MHAYIGGIMNNWVLDPAAYDLAGAAEGLADMIVAGLRAAPPRVQAGRLRKALGATALQAARDAVGKG
jgi:hypothetical protein